MAQLNIIDKVMPLYISDKRYIILKGGRGSGKSQSTAEYCLLQSLGIDDPFSLGKIKSNSSQSKKILCTREYQSSIKNSVHALLSRKIYENGLSKYFKITDKEIRTITGSSFIFQGLTRNIEEVKSTDNVDICWVEEAEKVSAHSWDNLIPTIRNKGSKFIIVFNPYSVDSATYQRFITSNRDNTEIISLNYYDNPYFHNTSLVEEMEYDKANNYSRYKHVWLGEPVTYSEAIVFANKFEVCYFETPNNTHFYFGADWGFSQDPTTLIRCYIHEQCLYIDREIYQRKLEIDETAIRFKQMDGLGYNLIYGDCADPAIISHLKRQGLNIIGAKKWANSVDEGVKFLQNFKKIYIHPDCKNTILEFELYSYKVNKNTGQVLKDFIDANNHAIDAIRYALNDFITNKVHQFYISDENIRELDTIWGNTSVSNLSSSAIRFFRD